MNPDVLVLTTEDSVEVVFYIEHPKVLAIGENMNEICEDAYMNGYNWEAFLTCYLEQNAPALLEDMETDPEAGMFVAYYSNTPENQERAEQFAKLISDLLDEEEELYAFLREFADEISWD